jgi:GT2 family glycosyltransferase
MYLEDIDLCRRLGQAGLEIWLHPGIKVVHGWRKSSRTRPYFALYHHHLSVLKYFAKYYPTQIMRNSLLAAILLIGFIFSSLLILIGEKDPK